MSPYHGLQLNKNFFTERQRIILSSTPAGDFPGHNLCALPAILLVDYGHSGSEKIAELLIAHAVYVSLVRLGNRADFLYGFS